MTAAVVPGRRRLPDRDRLVAGRRLHLALVAATAVVAATSSGDAFVLAALLGLVAADLAVAGVASLSATTLTIVFGTSSLAAAAGAQGVLGPAGLTGSSLAALAAWFAGVAIVTVSPRGLPVFAFGAAGGAFVAGPDVGGHLSDLGVRALGLLVGIAAASAASRFVPRRAARWVAASGGLLALVAAGLSRW